MRHPMYILDMNRTMEMRVSKNGLENFSCRSVRESAWNALRGNWLFACLVGFIYESISVVVRVPMDDDSLFWCSVSFLVAVFESVLSLGFFGCFLDIVRKKPLRFSRMLSGYSSVRFFLKVLWMEILASVFIFLWMLLLVIPGIVKSFSYSLSYFILLDHPEYSARGAISRSAEMMRGHKWELLKLLLSFWKWWLLAIVTCGIAMIWVFPYFMTAFAKFYDRLENEA